MTKKITLFITLKIIELTALVFGPYYLGKYLHVNHTEYFFASARTASTVNLWGVGFMTMLLSVLALAAIGILIALNWSWVNNILD